MTSGRYVPWIVLALGLAGTVWLWFATTAELASVTRIKFDASADAIRESIVQRLDDYEALLLGGRGLFAASKSVERDEWHAYVERLQVSERYPGVQGMGFSVRVAPDQKDEHIRAVRAEGYPEYTIRPATERNEYTAIVYLEPFSGRNLRAFGFDMFTEPTRRAAMERARDTNLPAASGKVKLVQETNDDVQAGFLLYVPVYKNGAPTETVSERRDALLGFVYSPFRANDLIDAVVAPGGKIQQEINFDIYDGDAATAETQLYRYEHLLPPLSQGYTPLFTKQEHIEFSGRSWQVNFSSRPAFDAANYRSEPLYILFAGVVLSIFLFTSIRRFTETRDRALELAREITASLHASTERLKVSEQRFDLAVRGSHDGIWDWDVRSNSVYYSSRFKELIDHIDSEISNSFDEWQKRLHPADVERTLEKIRRHFDLHEPFDVEFRLRTRDGEWRWFRARGQAVWDSEGKPIRMAGSLTDISEHKKVERMKSEFVATVSHELRTPLTAIRGSLGLISGGALGGLPDKASELIALAARNSERLLHLINDILDVEKIESGRLEFKHERLAVGSLLRQSIEINAPYAAQYGVSLRLLVDNEALVVQVDPHRFLQVMDNLLSNAIKFSPKAGSVEIRCAAQGARVRVSVVDKGPGIPDEFRSRIFQKFSQADSSSTRQKAGTGLGLNISKALVERLGGQLEFTSIVGEGSTFFFELPIALDVSRTA